VGVSTRISHQPAMHVVEKKHRRRTRAASRQLAKASKLGKSKNQKGGGLKLQIEFSSLGSPSHAVKSSSPSRSHHQKKMEMEEGASPTSQVLPAVSSAQNRDDSSSISRAQKGRFSPINLPIMDDEQQHVTYKEIVQLAKVGNTEMMEVVSRSGISLVDQIDTGGGGRTLAHFAASSGQAEMLRCLHCEGVDLSGRTKFGDTPAHMAAYQGHVACLRLIWEDSILVGIRPTLFEGNDRGDTPLHKAAQQGHADAVRFLVSLDSRRQQLSSMMMLEDDGYDSDEHDSNALMLRSQSAGEDFSVSDRRAGRGGILSVVTSSASPTYFRSVLDVRNKLGLTPFELAAKAGKVDMLVIMAKSNAFRGDSDFDDVNTPVFPPISSS
jgi:hypothetical protein